MRAEIIAIGDEITSGQTLDTNSQWISQRLEELGVRVLYHTTIGDELDVNVAAFHQALQRAEIVIATGGLGPTADDLTRQALAQATGRDLVLDPQALEHVRQLFARRKRPMPPQNEIQAYFPAGSRVVPNPHGTAPGIALNAPRPDGTTALLIALPGVPAELRQMWQGSVVDLLRAQGAGQRIVVHHCLRCFGAGESQIEAMLPDLIRRGRVPRVGITASQATITLRITAEGADAAACRAAMAPTIDTIRQCLGSLVYGEEDDLLQDAVVRLLGQCGQTLATIETGSGGLLAQGLAAAAQNDGVYRGGWVVPAADAEPRDATCADAAQVSAAAAEGLALSCRRQFGSDHALAITAFSPPSADEPRQVFVAWSSPAAVTSKIVPLGLSPDLWKAYAMKQALNFLRLGLLDNGPR